MYGRMGGGASALSIPGVRVIVAYLLAQVGIYPVVYHGLVTGGTSANAAANTTALQALWATCLTATRGVIVFTPGVWPLNATDLTTATPGSIGVSVSIEGVGKGATILEFYGSSGPFLNVAPSAGSIQRWHIKQLLIQHDSVSTGACIQLSGSVATVNIEDVEVAAGGFLIGIQTAHSTDLFLTRCKINTRTDYATMNGSLNPIALNVTNTTNLGGIYITNTELGCCQAPDYYGTILALNNTGPVDTVVIGDGCHLIGGNVGILKNAGADDVSNVLIGKAYITQTNTGIQAEPPSGAVFENLFCTGTWLDSNNYNVLVSAPSGSTVRHISLVGCYATNATVRGFYFGPGVNGIVLADNMVMTSVSAAGRCGVEIGDGSTASESVNFTGGIVSVGAATDGAYVIGAAVDGVTVAHVTQRGAVGVFNGATDASRVHVAGAFLA